MTSTSSPTERSPIRIASTRRRRVGSPRISNTSATMTYYACEICLVNNVSSPHASPLPHWSEQRFIEGLHHMPPGLRWFRAPTHRQQHDLGFVVIAQYDRDQRLEGSGHLHLDALHAGDAASGVGAHESPLTSCRARDRLEHDVAELDRGARRPARGSSLRRRPCR